MSVEGFLVYADIITRYLGVSTWSDMLVTLLLVVGACVAGLVLSEGLIFIWELRLSVRHELTTLRTIILTRLPIVKKFRERQSRLTRNIDIIDEEIRKIASKQTALTSKLRQTQEMQSHFVRTIGENIRGAKCYRALVMNQYVKSYVSEGKRHPLYDDSWARAQIIEIWSSSQPTALMALRQEYSQAQGFTIDKIEPIKE